MSNATFSEIGQLLRDFFHQLIEISRPPLEGMARLPLAQLLIVCIGVALILTVLPLALMLFLAFLLIKALTSSSMPNATNAPHENETGK
jgi:hypothetical protein